MPAERSVPLLPQGEVRIVPLNDPNWPGWLQVSIGRAKFTKVFNLSDPEARQVRDQLAKLLAG